MLLNYERIFKILLWGVMIYIYESIEYVILLRRWNFDFYFESSYYACGLEVFTPL